MLFRSIPPTGIYPINTDPAPDRFNITGIVSPGYKYETDPNNYVEASCFNVSYSTRKKLFQVLVWKGPSASGIAGEELFDISGTPPRFNCNCSTDCGANSLYPRVCAGAAVARDVITGARINGTGLCNVKSVLGDCFSHADCQPSTFDKVQIKRYCAQLFHKTRAAEYKERQQGSCFLCPNFGNPPEGAINCFGGNSAVVKNYPPILNIGANNFCPDTITYKEEDGTSNTSSIDSYVPAWCPDSNYCLGLGPNTNTNKRNICFNTEDTIDTTPLSLDRKLYHCISPLYQAYLPSDWHWDPSLFPKLDKDASLLNANSFSPNSQQFSKGPTGVFLYVDRPVCPATLAFFNLVNYSKTNIGWDQGGNMDVFYPCFKITVSSAEFNSSGIQHGNCADKKRNSDTWPLYTVYNSENSTDLEITSESIRDKNLVRHSLEQDKGLLYNNHLPYNRAQCTANHDKFFVFLGTQKTVDSDYRNVIQTDGYGLITDDVCMFWNGGILEGSSLVTKPQNAGTSNETYYYPDRQMGAYFNDDQMKLFLYALNDYVIKNDNGMSKSFKNSSFQAIMNNFHNENFNTCLISLCKLTNLRTIPALWEPSNTEYAQEVERYYEIENMSKAECLNVNNTDTVWLEEEGGECSPKKMSLGLRLQKSLQCVHKILNATVPKLVVPGISAPTVVPISNTTASGKYENHSYSFYGKSYNHDNETNQIGNAYNDIQDILLHVIPNSNGKSSSVPNKINHTTMAEQICERYNIQGDSSYFYLNDTEDIIISSSSGSYATIDTTKETQKDKPGVSAHLIFFGNNELSNPPQACFRSNNMIRDLQTVSPVVLPQVQASLPAATLFSGSGCNTNSTSQSYDFSYLCFQMHYDSTLRNQTIVGSNAKTLQDVCDYLYAKILQNKNLDHRFDSQGRILFDNITNNIRHQLTDSLILADAINGYLTTELPRQNGCYELRTGSFRLWSYEASTYKDERRDRSAEGWSACMRYLEDIASTPSNANAETFTPYIDGIPPKSSIYKTFSNFPTVSEGI